MPNDSAEFNKPFSVGTNSLAEIVTFASDLFLHCSQNLCDFCFICGLPNFCSRFQYLDIPIRSFRSCSKETEKVNNELLF